MLVSAKVRGPVLFWGPLLDNDMWRNDKKQWREKCNKGLELVTLWFWSAALTPNFPYLYIETIIWSVLICPSMRGFFPGHSPLHTNLRKETHRYKVR